jgi:hypothetical protein
MLLLLGPGNQVALHGPDGLLDDVLQRRHDADALLVREALGLELGHERLRVKVVLLPHPAAVQLSRQGPDEEGSHAQAAPTCSNGDNLGRG